MSSSRHLSRFGARFKDRYKTGLVSEVAKLRPRNGSDPITYTTLVTMRGLARRIQHLDAEMPMSTTATQRTRSPTRHRHCSSSTGLASTPQHPCSSPQGTTPTDSASEGSWAHLCGVTPIPASSGKTTRYRLNRGGDRHANAALYRIVLTRMSSDPRTRDYVTTAQSRRQIQPRDHALPQTLRRPRNVQAPPDVRSGGV